MTPLRQSWIQTGLPLDILEQLNTALNFEGKISHQDTVAKPVPPFQEYEVKLRCPDELLEEILQLHLQYSGSALEDNLIFDTHKLPLHALDARLRLRLFHDLNGQPEQALVTVKTPRPCTRLGRNEFEAQTLITGNEVATLKSALLGEGFIVVSSYQRIRHRLHLSNQAVEFDIDVLPDIGRFVEIEGEENAVDQIAQQLSPLPSMNEPYDTLHAEWCLAHNRAEEDHISFRENLEQSLAEARRLSLQLSAATKTMTIHN